LCPSSHIACILYTAIIGEESSDFSGAHLPSRIYTFLFFQFLFIFSTANAILVYPAQKTDFSPFKAEAFFFSYA